MFRHVSSLSIVTVDKIACRRYISIGSSLFKSKKMTLDEIEKIDVGVVDKSVQPITFAMSDLVLQPTHPLHSISKSIRQSFTASCGSDKLMDRDPLSILQLAVATELAKATAAWGAATAISDQTFLQ